MAISSSAGCGLPACRQCLERWVVRKHLTTSAFPVTSLRRRQGGMCAMSQVENLSDVYDTAENYDAPQLAKRCVLFALEHFATSSPPPPNFDNLLRRMGPKVCARFSCMQTR